VDDLSTGKGDLFELAGRGHFLLFYPDELKTLQISSKLWINGFNEEQAEDELYLLSVLGATDDTALYGMICAALGNAGGLFSIPTLMVMVE